jgi:hypothetical protein
MTSAPTFNPKPLEFSRHNLGRGHRGWKPGKEVFAISDIFPGHILIQLTSYADGAACNMVVCLMGAAIPQTWGRIAYFQFLMTPFAQGGFAVWDHELKPENRRLFRAVQINQHSAYTMEAFTASLPKFRTYDFGTPVPVPARDAVAARVAHIPALRG